MKSEALTSLKILVEQKANTSPTAILDSQWLLDQLIAIEDEIDMFHKPDKTIFDVDADDFEKELQKDVAKKHKGQTELFGEEVMQKVERDIFLQVLDNLWMQHLENMDHLRQGINWISVGQKDPLVEYRRQSQVLFEEMQNGLRHQTIHSLFHAKPVSQDRLDAAVDTELTIAARNSVDNADKVLSTKTRIDDDDFSSNPDDSSATKPKVSQAKKKQKRKSAKKARAKQRKKR